MCVCIHIYVHFNICICQIEKIHILQRKKEIKNLPKVTWQNSKYSIFFSPVFVKESCSCAVNKQEIILELIWDSASTQNHYHSLANNSVASH